MVPVGVLGSRHGVRQQPLANRPGIRILAVIGEARPQQAYRHPSPTPLGVGVEVTAAHRLQQPVGRQSVADRLNQRVAAQRPNRFGEEQLVCCDLGQGLR